MPFSLELMANTFLFQWMPTYYTFQMVTQWYDQLIQTPMSKCPTIFCYNKQHWNKHSLEAWLSGLWEVAVVGDGGAGNRSWELWRPADLRGHLWALRTQLWDQTVSLSQHWRGPDWCSNTLTFRDPEQRDGPKLERTCWNCVSIEMLSKNRLFTERTEWLKPYFENPLHCSTSAH